MQEVARWQWAEGCCRQVLSLLVGCWLFLLFEKHPWFEDK